MWQSHQSQTGKMRADVPVLLPKDEWLAGMEDNARTSH